MHQNWKDDQKCPDDFIVQGTRERRQSPRWKRKWNSRKDKQGKMKRKREIEREWVKKIGLKNKHVRKIVPSMYLLRKHQIDPKWEKNKPFLKLPWLNLANAVLNDAENSSKQNSYHSRMTHLRRYSLINEVVGEVVGAGCCGVFGRGGGRASLRRRISKVRGAIASAAA